jgi:hypothetical protein
VKYAVQIGSGVIIYIPSFINIGSDIQKLERKGRGVAQAVSRWLPTAAARVRDRAAYNMLYILLSYLEHKYNILLNGSV